MRQPAPGILRIICGIVLGVLVMAPYASGADAPFWIYKDHGFTGNHYSPDGWMGDHADLKMDTEYKVPALEQPDPYEGNTVLRFDYRPGSKVTDAEGWIGVYFLHPAGNWGNTEEGLGLNGYTRLSFYIKGVTGTEVIHSFRVGGVTGEFSDTATLEIKKVPLTRYWQKIVIPLGGHDLSRIAGAFAWTATAEDNPQGASFLIDEIRLE